MRYPNLRYGDRAVLNYYTMGVPLAAVARRLRRDERTVRDWMNGKRKVPWWVGEILRLQHMEADLRHRQMGMGPLKARLGVVSGEVIALAPPTDEKKPQARPGLVLVDPAQPVVTCA